MRAETATPPRIRTSPAADAGILQAIDLVQHHEPRPLRNLQLPEERVHRGHVLVELRMAGIDHVQEDVGLRQFFQGRPERGHQLVRELPDEAHGIGQDERLLPVAVHRSGRGIEGDEELVGRRQAPIR